VEPAVTVAVIAAISSLAVAVISALFARRAQRFASAAETAADANLENLKAAHTESQSERDARRDYEYDARRRLYEGTEPLLFQLVERAEELQDRIAGLARTARNGELEPNKGWLSSGDDYYLRTTIHRLVAPVSIFQLIQERLTMVDLGLDKLIRMQYGMSRLLAWAITDHFRLAESPPPILHYDPYARHPNKVSRFFQGLPSGLLETAGQSLIVQTESGTARVMRFGEFNSTYDNLDSPVRSACEPVSDLMLNFHPRSHPVLWRTLIAQAHLCAAFKATRDRATVMDSDRESSVELPWEMLPAGERTGYDWRQSTDADTDEDVLEDPFTAARAYLRANLKL
jgi:hypothetical protein